MHWFKKEILKKYPSTLYISINKIKYSKVESKRNQQEIISIDSSNLQNEINSDSISSGSETYQV